MRIPALLFTATLCCASSAAAPLVFEPDDFAAGTELSSAVPGVTLSTVASDLGDTAVFAVDPREADWASTGDLVFGHAGDFPEHWVTNTNTPFRYGTLRIDFDLGYDVTSIRLDVNGNDDNDIGLVQAFASDGTLLSSMETDLLDADSFEVIELTTASPIAYVIAGGKDQDTVSLDNLVIIPEPASLVILLALGVLSRRKTAQ